MGMETRHGNTCTASGERIHLLEETKKQNGVIVEQKHGRTQKPSKGRKLMVLVCALVLQCMSVGLGFGLSVMYPELVSVFGELRSKAALIQGIYLGITCGAGILLTGLIKRIGPGPTVIIGSVLACVGFFTSAFAENVSTVIVLSGVLAGFGMSACYLSAFIAVSWTFHEDAGFPLVCVTIGSSIGQCIIPLLYELFISTYTWSGGFMLISALPLQCIPFGVIMFTSRSYYVTNDARSKTSTSEPRSSWSGYATLLSDPLMWILLFDFLLIALTGNVEAMFIVDIMTSRGYTREAGSILVSAIGFANFLGRVSGSTLRFKCTRVPTVYHWLWLCPLIAGGHALVLNITEYWALFFACIIQGTTFGMNNSQTPAIMFDVWGNAYYPQAMSLVNVMYGFGNIFSNAFGGFIRDTYGRYDIVFYAAIGSTLWITVNSGVASWIVHKRRKQKGTYRIGKLEYETLS